MPSAALPTSRSLIEGRERLLFKLQYGGFVSLTKYADDRGLHLVWPTPLRSRAFFDNATTALAFEYDMVVDTRYRDEPLGVPKDRLKTLEHMLVEARLSLPDEAGDLVWTKGGVFGRQMIGVLETSDLNEVSINELLGATGTVPVVANLGQIVTQALVEHN